MTERPGENRASLVGAIISVVHTMHVGEKPEELADKVAQAEPMLDAESQTMAISSPTNAGHESRVDR
jgi:hypothetical protein